MSAWEKEVLKWSRTLHIYLSLLGMAMFLFFALTGVQLTHESFGLDEANLADTTLQIPLAVAKSAQREAVLAALQIPLGVERFEVGEQEISIAWMRPGERAQLRLDRTTGRGDLHWERRGWVGALADLHKGAATGWAWRWLMDLTCLWIVVSTVTGFMMVLALPKRKALGLLSAAAGTLLALAAYALIPAG